MRDSKNMKTTIVSGMLGAGKTSFIRHLLRKTDERVVVLVNDFGQAGIDGEIFSADGIETVELPSGCVCCSLKFDLMTTLARTVETFSPDHIVIEPSGVAAPSGVIEALFDAGIRQATVVSVVDATEFAELHALGMYDSHLKDQIVNADVVLVNKTDIADAGQADLAVRIVEDVNPHALVFRTVHAALNEPLPDPAPVYNTIARAEAPRHLDALSIRPSGDPAPAEIERLFTDMLSGRYGDVVRAKALIQTADGPFRFDLASGRVDSSRFGRAVLENRVVVIGSGLKKEALASAVGSGESTTSAGRKGD
jgi:G3E family GTPase